MKQLDDYDNHEYKKTCDGCGKEHSVFTQAENCPEYYTDVALQCDCGEYVMFNLPVN